MPDDESEPKVCGCGQPAASYEDGKEFLCPFQLEVNGLEFACDCCFACRRECRERI
jgi:hypothetical protein